MSRPVILTLPSCMSLGWTNLISPIRFNSLSSTAQTRPSKSLRVTKRYFCCSDMAFSLAAPKSYLIMLRRQAPRFRDERIEPGRSLLDLLVGELLRLQNPPFEKGRPIGAKPQLRVVPFGHGRIYFRGTILG